MKTSMRHPALFLQLPLFATISTARALSPTLQDPLMQSPYSEESSSRRRVIIRETSNSIRGSYPLYDLLSISSQSGSVSISVAPHSASCKGPSEPANLQIRSKSGSVHVDLSEALDDYYARANGAPPPDQPPSYSSLFDEDSSNDVASQSGFPQREYITSISSQSGSISGTFPLGARTTIDSRSGSLNGVDLVVMPTNTTGSTFLSTVSHGGSQSVRIVEDSFWVAGGKKKDWWKGMVSRHESFSGSINVDYPDAWEGTIEVETGSGSINIDGRGVRVIRKGKGRVTAQKGEGSGKVFAKARSGTVNLRFG